MTAGPQRLDRERMTAIPGTDPEGIRSELHGDAWRQATPTVSVVIPCYNARACVAQAMDSVRNQSFRDIELIVVDDGSSDDSTTIIKDYLHQHSDFPILFLENTPSGGRPGLTRNAGIACARGRFILCLDADDLLFPATIGEMVQAAKASSGEFPVAHGAYERFGSRDGYWPWPVRQVDPNTLIRQNHLSIASLFPKTLWEKAGGFSGMRGYEDWELWVSFARLGATFVPLTKPVYRVRFGNGDTVNRRAKQRHEWFVAQVILQHEDLFEEDEVGWARDLLTAHPGEPPESRKPYTGNVPHAFATALRIAAWPSYYPPEEVQWAADWFQKNQPELKRGVRAGSNPAPRIKTVVSGAPQDILGSAISEPKTIAENALEMLEKNGESGEIKSSVDSHLERPSQSLKVLYICHDFPPYRYAGAQLYALQMAKRLMKRGIQVDVLHPVFREEGEPDYSIRQNKFEGLDVFELLKASDPEHTKYVNQKAGEAVLNWLQNRHYDLVHVHGLGQLSSTVLLALKERGIPILMTLHDFWLLCDSWHMVDEQERACSGPETPEKCAVCYLTRLQNKLNEKYLGTATRYEEMRREVMKQSFDLIDIALAPSQFLADRFAQYGMHGVRVHRNGLKATQPLAKQKHDGLVFGFFGQIILRKGVDLLVEAFNHPELANVRLEIHGKIYEPHFGERLLPIIEAIPNVTYHGAYEPDRLPELYSTVDMVVVPSRMDNYPTTVLEANMNRTPVIGSRAGGIPEMVEHDKTGLLFESESVSSLQEMLLKVVRNPDLAREYSQHIEPPLTVESDMEATLEIYRELLDRKSRVSTEKPEHTRSIPPEASAPGGVPKQQSPVEPGDRAAKTTLPVNKKKPIRVVLLFMRNVHVPVLMPILRRLVHEPNVKLELVAPMQTSERSNLAKLGLPLHEDANGLTADVGFMADNLASFLPKCTFVINVGHGLISKGQYFTSNSFSRRENLQHLLCVPGTFHKQRLLEDAGIHIPVEVTGFVKLDPLFDGSLPSPKTILEQLGIPTDRKMVLYAPTFNIALSSIPVIWMRIRHLATPDQTLCIKLHGSTLPPFIEHHQKLAEKHDTIHFINDCDITPYLAAADVVVSDVSSVAFEAMLLGKPVVLFNNPNARDYDNFDPNDIEWAWRDMAFQANNMDELLAGVQQAIENPETKAERAAHYRSLLDIPTDGRAAYRIINLMWRLVNNDKQLRGSSWSRRVDVIFPSADILPHFSELDFHAQAEVKPYVLCAHEQNLPALPEPYTWLPTSNLDTLNGEYVVLYDPQFESSNRWLFHLLNHLKDADTESGVFPRYLDVEGPQGVILPAKDERLHADPELIPPLLLHNSHGKHLPFPNPPVWTTGAWRRNSAGWKVIALAIEQASQPIFADPPVICLDVLLWPRRKPVSTPALATPAQTAAPASRPTNGKRVRLIRHYQQKGNLEKAQQHLKQALAEGENSPEILGLKSELMGSTQ